MLRLCGREFCTLLLKNDPCPRDSSEGERQTESEVSTSQDLLACETCQSKGQKAFVRAQMTLIEIKPHRWGWNVFLASGVKPCSTRKKRQSITRPVDDH
jgi:hypothetical protein